MLGGIDGQRGVSWVRRLGFGDREAWRCVR